MTSTPTSPTTTTLVLGGTGKTGRRIADRLRRGGATVRTAARRGADVHFDWDDPSTHDAALAGVGAVYLVPPGQSVTFASQVHDLLDRAQSAGVGHVTYLSARGVEHAPAEVAMRAVELDLAARGELTHTVLRPGWFMQNFSEYIFQPDIAADGTIAVPTGNGAEAFVHADDIADVAVATLSDPDAHDGAGYTLTGPDALTFAEVASAIGAAVGRTITHVDVERGDWLAGALAGGVPEPYAHVLAGLFDNIRAGFGASTTDDIAAVTGHAPRSFAEYVADEAARASWRVPSTV
jgi:uncharacterized protein YbjT (DUF2867 family)